MEEKIIHLTLKNDTNKIYVNNLINICNINADEAYICIDKFYAIRNGINIPYIDLTCNGLRDIYENDIDIGLNLSSNLDEFYGEYITPIAGVNTQTKFNMKYQYENWKKINTLDLDKLILNFIPFQSNPLVQVTIDFFYTLCIKIKFIKK